MSRYLTGHTFRYRIGVVVLKDILFNRSSSDKVIALPPSGLKDAYSRTISKAGGVVVAISDTPENILKRIVFCDMDSNPIDKHLTDDDKKHYLKEIKKDITYFGKTYKRAHLLVDIAGLSIENSVAGIQDAIQSYVRGN
jgi:shikimate kinase